MPVTRILVVVVVVGVVAADGTEVLAVGTAAAVVVVGCGRCSGHGGTTAVGTAAAVVVVVAVVGLMLLGLPLLW